jgi:FkbM family methyltransferase
MITFRKDFGCWWPDYDHKPEACFSRVKKRVSDMDAAVRLAHAHNVCVQAGGHAGHWARRLAKSFKHVLTFEPERELYECLCRNTEAVGNIYPRPYALGAFVGEVRMVPHVSAGSWRVASNGTVPVPQITIDSLNLSHCDAIFLDVEGYEVDALQGAGTTLARFSPVLHVELLPRSKAAIETFMASSGYRLRKTIHNDAVFTREVAREVGVEPHDHSRPRP